MPSGGAALAPTIAAVKSSCCAWASLGGTVGNVGSPVAGTGATLAVVVGAVDGDGVDVAGRDGATAPPRG